MLNPGFLYSVRRNRPRTLLLGATLLFAPQVANAAPTARTFCNPINLPYRFALENNDFTRGKSLREAADPTMVFHKGTFWLFASKSGGYWHSKDMVNWNFVEPTGFPVEDYAPAVTVLGDKWLMMASRGSALFTTDDPASGKWTKIRDFLNLADPELFVDEDNRLYLFSGSSPDQPIFGIELDPRNNFEPIGQQTALIPGLDPLRHGWEARNQFGSDEQLKAETYLPWMEGPTMIKHNGTYYLQYGAPGTEMPVYADGVYTSNKPLGPYRYAPYNPFSYKPSGFITSAGHASTYRDGANRAWRVASMLIGVNYMFERRLGIFPVGFVPDGNGPDEIVCNTYLGDYPQFAPGRAKNPAQDNFAGWLLLSLKKTATATSSLDNEHGPEKAFDEDIRTWWAAATNKPGEALTTDLGKRCRINAVQINFADAKSTAYGRLRDAYRYTLEVSDDGKKWRTCVDRTNNVADAPHDYIELPKPVFARYVRLTNVYTPAGAVFSVSGLRLFGSGLGKAPEKVTGVNVERQSNRRLMKVSWNKAERADFYIVRYGIAADKLRYCYQVYDGQSVTIPGLNTDQEYFVAVDAINDSGITKGYSS